MARIDFLNSDSKRALLQLMKRQGEVSLDDAEEAMGLARTTLREHLAGLERDGLVAHYAKRQGRGRPSLRYRLTEDGERLFPIRDGVLLRELLVYLQQEGPADLLNDFFGRFWERRLREVKHRLEHVEPGDLNGKLEVLEQILHEQGFMPEVQATDEEIVVRECNCPFPEAVKQTRVPCRLEAQFIEQVLQSEARRVSYIPEGSTACTYAFQSQRRHDGAYAA